MTRAAVALAGLLLLAGTVRETVAQTTPGVGRELYSYYVTCTTTLAHLAVANPSRKNLTINNVGSTHVNVGRTGGPPSQVPRPADFAGYRVASGSGLSFTDYVGGLDCQTATSSSLVEILEETR